MTRPGYALLTVIFIMLVLAVLGIGIVSLIFAGSRSAVDGYRYDKAFYIADAGRVYGTKYVNGLGNWLTALTTPVTESFGGGCFTITGTNQATSYIKILSIGVFTAEGKTYQRAISITLTKGGLADFANHVFYCGAGGAGGGTTTVGNNTAINGDLLINSSLVFGGGSTVSGDAYATGTITGGTISGSREPGSALPSDLPALNTAYYDDQINLAAASSIPSQNWNDYTVNADIYINGNLTINNNKTVTVVGSPKIVVNGSVTTGNSVIVGNNLTIIAAGSVVMGNGTIIGDYCLLYSRVGFVFGNDLDTASFAAGRGTSFLTPGYVTMGNNATIYGFIYSGGNVVMGNGTAFTGNIVANHISAIGNNSTLTQNSTLVDYSFIPGFYQGSTTVTTAIGTWEESY